MTGNEKRGQKLFILKIGSQVIKSSLNILIHIRTFLHPDIEESGYIEASGYQNFQIGSYAFDSSISGHPVKWVLL